MKPFVFITLLLSIWGLSSCDSGGSRSSRRNPAGTIARASGGAYEIFVVMDKAVWEGTAGQAVKEELSTPLPYLLQGEPSMKPVTHIKPEQFKGVLRFFRNILIVRINDAMYTKVSLQKEFDNWAQGQIIVFLNAPDQPSVETYLSEHPQSVLNLFTKEEMIRAGELLREKHSLAVLNQVREKFGIELYAPADIQASKEGDNCIWFSNKAFTGRMDIFVYSFPYVDRNTFTLDYLVAKRDSFAKYMIPGSFEGSYMATEKRVVDYEASTLNGKYCGVLRGLWRTEGDMMGGPFVSYARVDEPNRRVIVTEGFVFEPRKEKRNYIRRLEAALQTTRFASEL